MSKEKTIKLEVRYESGVTSLDKIFHVISNMKGVRVVGTPYDSYAKPLKKFLENLHVDLSPINAELIKNSKLLEEILTSINSKVKTLRKEIKESEENVHRQASFRM